MGLQLGNLASQVELNKSQANKNNAEAEKIKGVDTDVQKATMENIIAQTSNEKITAGTDGYVLRRSGSTLGLYWNRLR